jgi:hypothetical protein
MPAVLILLTMLAGCAYSRGGNALVIIDRRLDIESQMGVSPPAPPASTPKVIP